MADVNQTAKQIVDEATRDKVAEDAFWDTFYDRCDEYFTPWEAALILEEFGRLYDLEEDVSRHGQATARELGRRGGLKGGVARAASMTPEQRSDSARKAAQARWSKPR